KFPDLKGFWKEIIEEVPSLQFQEEIVNGVLYRKALLASHALFPIKPGVSVIDEFKIKAKVRLPTQFGWGDLHEYTKASKRFPVTVLPLPSENKPKSFSGAVGQFQIQTQVDGSQFPAGQPFSVRVRFEGQGNAKLIELPEIEWPQGLEVYDTKSEAKFFKDGQSFKEFEILVVPRNQGDVKIPEIKFSYFDPVLKQYITKSTEEFNLKITEAVKGNVNSINAANNSNSLENKDTAQIFLPVADISSSWFSWTKYRLLFFVTLSFLVFIGFVIKFGLDMVNLNQIPELKHKVIAKLKTIEKHKKNNDYKLVGAEAVNLLYLIAAHLAQENTSTQDWSSLVYKMPEAYRSAYADKLSDLFEYFQTLGFAPDSLKELALSRNSLDSMASDLKVTANKIVAEIS
ncbi:MAG: BatD family protein, partial [Pseudobdellovibrio sp.]